MARTVKDILMGREQGIHEAPDMGSLGHAALSMLAGMRPVPRRRPDGSLVAWASPLPMSDRPGSDGPGRECREPGCSP